MDSEPVSGRDTAGEAAPASKLKLGPPVPVPKLKKRVWRKVHPDTVREWKRAAYKRRRRKKLDKRYKGTHGMGKRVRVRRGKGAEIKVVAPEPGVRITLPPKRVMKHAKPKIAPVRLQALLGEGNYKRIARGSGFTPRHIANVLRDGRNCSFHAAAQIADAAGVTLDELRIYQEVRRNAIEDGQ